MKILFLDQNKWIDIARAASGVPSSAEHTKLYHSLADAIEAGRVIAPLTMAHIIETSKKNDLSKRKKLAETQSKLSKGLVFRNRKSRLLQEIRVALMKAFGEPVIKLPDTWVIARVFLQAFEGFDDYVAPSTIGASDLLYDFLVSQNDDNRRKGIAVFSQGTNELVTNIEGRRQKWKSASRNMQSRAYAAQLFFDHQELIFSVLLSIGHSVEEFKQLGDSALLALLQDIPALNVERELVIKLESQSRDIPPNDLLDMYSFCAAIPYADWLIAENAFVTLAKQAKLDIIYRTKITNNLGDLSMLLDECT